MKPIPTGPAVPGKTEAGPRRGSDAPTAIGVASPLSADLIWAALTRAQIDAGISTPLLDELRTQLHALLAATRSKAIEECAKIADGFAERTAFTTYALARDIAADIRALDGAAIEARGGDHLDFPWWGFA